MRAIKYFIVFELDTSDQIHVYGYTDTVTNYKAGTRMNATRHQLSSNDQYAARASASEIRM